MITRKSTYGLRALAAMAREPGRLHSVAEISDNFGIPRAYLTSILGTLRRHGFVEGLRGPAGGYGLLVDPAEVSVASVIEVLDGPLFFPLVCIGPGAEPCPECSAGCPARSALLAAHRAAWRELEGMRIADLVQASTPVESRSEERPALQASNGH